jgi:hypothetical protein
MQTNIPLCSALLAVALLSGCDAGPKSGRGFVFPEGDIARGRKAFVELKCHTCHQVQGVADLPAPTVAPDKVVPLGGEVVRLRTYGDLVTAVIHPANALTVRMPGPEPKKSPMPQVNDAMTVAQMLDIVTFLHAHYRQLRLPGDDNYGR